MFGRIIGIDGNTIRMINNLKRAEIGLINYHVIFEDSNTKFIGVISNVDEEIIDIILIGEIVNNNFIPGIIKKPKLSSTCRIITKSELEYILGSQEYVKRYNLLLGNSITYNNYKITVDKDNFLANHFAILGNTGSGKSCGVARILQNIFYYNESNLPTNAHILIFDAYGEYDNALKEINKKPGLHYKKYNCKDKNIDDNEILKFPSYFLDVTDLTLLLDVESIELIPVIENTLRITYIFTSTDEKIREYKNNIIAGSLQDILASGKPANQIADQIIAVLTKFYTEDINLDTIISQPGFDRTLRQCLNINDQGKMTSINLVVDYLTQFTKLNIEQIDISKGFVYSLEDLYNALEFSLINEGVLSSSRKFDQLNTLKVRLRSIINSNVKTIFDYNEVITKEEYIRKFFINNNGQACQIVDVNFDELEDRFAKLLTKIFAKLFFEFVTTIPDRTSFPIHLIIEEAHRYVQNDNDINIIGYNIFEKITKIGRKYGMLLGVITQRPSELSKTVLSQCSNFVVFRMYHPEDIEIVLSLSTVVTVDTEDKIKSLHPGMALCFGSGFKVPTITKFDLPNPMPKSSSLKVDDIWYR